MQGKQQTVGLMFNFNPKPSLIKQNLFKEENDDQQQRCLIQIQEQSENSVSIFNSLNLSPKLIKEYQTYEGNPKQQKNRQKIDEFEYDDKESIKRNIGLNRRKSLNVTPEHQNYLKVDSNFYSGFVESQDQQIVIPNGLNVMDSNLQTFSLLNIPVDLPRDVEIDQLKNCHLKIINDKAFNMFPQQINQTFDKNLIRQLSQKLSLILNYIPLLSPQKYHFYIWETIQLVIIIHNIILFALIQAFGKIVDAQSCNQWKNVYIVELILIIADIFFNLNLQVFDKGELTKDRGVIYQKYVFSYLIDLKSGLKYDLIGLSSFIILHRGIIFQSCEQYIRQDSKSSILQQWVYFILGYLYIVKYRKLQSIVKKLEKIFIYSNHARIYFRLVKIFIRYTFTIHLAVCIFHLISQYSLRFYNVNLLSQSNLEQNEWQLQYMYTYYFYFTTLTTIAYGDFHPQNDIERASLLFFFIFSPGLFAFTMGRMTDLISQLQHHSQNYKQQKTIITNYMKKKGMTYEFQMRIVRHLKHLHEFGMLENMEQENQIINKFSLSLKDEFIYNDKAQIFLNLKWFKKWFDNEKLLRYLCPLIKTVSFSPGDLVQPHLEQSMTKSSLCYIQQGSVGYFHNYKIDSVGDLIQEYHKGQYFGEEQFFTSKESQMTVVSKDFTIINYISREDFLSVIRKEEFISQQYHIFCMLRDKIMLSENIEHLQNQCSSCEGSHQIDKCNFISFQPNRFQIVRDYLEEQIQIRGKKERQGGKFQTLRNLDITQREVNFLQQKYGKRMKYYVENMINPLSKTSQDMQKLQTSEKASFSNLRTIQFEGSIENHSQPYVKDQQFTYSIDQSDRSQEEIILNEISGTQKISTQKDRRGSLLKKGGLQFSQFKQELQNIDQLTSITNNPKFYDQDTYFEKVLLTSPYFPEFSIENTKLQNKFKREAVMKLKYSDYLKEKFTMYNKK